MATLMIQGASSDAGKSTLVAGLCRVLRRQGVRVAPFKPQNMALNSAVTADGGEIGRAQALQAEAAGVPASVHMNPILLKPSSDTASQVIVRGKIFAEFSAEDYFRRRNEELVPIIRESYEILAVQNDLMVLEGAGSPAEVNLKNRDIVNLRMARLAGARCILVGDIDRGGVFASLFGTLALLEPSERDLIDGFVINKFRGDICLLSDGIRSLEERVGKPCLGVVPYIEGLRLDEEDSVSIEPRAIAPWLSDVSSERPLRVAIVRFPFISNFTDFDPLMAEPSVDARFCRTPEELAPADLVILPGSKQTVADLRWMLATGMDEVIRVQAERGLVVGICGGMQMLGTAIDDPHRVEGGETQAGLGLLSIQTTMSREKTTRVARGELIVAELFGEPLSSTDVQGYEIHVGQTEYLQPSSPFARIRRTGDSERFVLDGCTSRSGRVVGTYLHGILHEDAFRHAFLGAARKTCGLAPADTVLNWKQLRENEFKRLARTVADAVDPKRLLDLVALAWPSVSTEERACASKR